MKFILTIFVALLSLGDFAYADVKPAQVLAPQDIGAFKWIVGATGGEGEVVILRNIRTVTTLGKESKDIHDIVFYEPGKRHEGTFVAINPNFFNSTVSDVPNWHIAAFGGSAWCAGEYQSSKTGEGYGSISFKDSKGVSIKYEFTSIIMEYQKARTLYSDLPRADSIGWEWGGTPNQD